MDSKQRRASTRRKRSTDRTCTRSAAAAFAMAWSLQAWSFDIATGSETKVRWDNTFKYSSSWRLKDRSSELIADSNQDDGDRNFSKGLVSSRVDWLSELDVTYRNFGARVSGAAWYDSVYNRGNDHDSPGTVNSFSVPYNEFTTDTKDLHGRKAELLDAFVFGNFDVGESANLSLRFGRHTVIYGESLFFGANGIANGQGSVDYVKLLSVPNTQFKELLRPAPQLSGQLQVGPNLSFGAYYQFRWERNRIPAAGSYFSTVDFVGEGAERVFLQNPLLPPNFALYHGDDRKAKNSGQGGFQVRFRPEGMDTDFGLYAIRYHDKNPQVYLSPGCVPNPFGPVPPLLQLSGTCNVLAGGSQFGQFGFVYPENVRAYGASFSTVLGTTNVAGEFSVRHNAILVSNAATILPGTAFDNDANNPFAVGNSGHAQISWIHSFGASAMWDGASLMGEVAWNRLLSITRNPAMLDPNATRDAWGFRMVFEPTYYQVAPGLDISIPVGLGYNPKGRSSTVANFNGGVDRGGDVSIGVNGEYEKRWKLGLNFTHYIGDAGVALIAGQGPSFKQALKDRDFVSFNATYSF